jgi:putative copper export protein
MFKRILFALGLRKAPAPIQRYVAASSFVGGLPALGYVLFKHRGDIANLLRRAQSRFAGPKVITADV